MYIAQLVYSTTFIHMHMQLVATFFNTLTFLNLVHATCNCTVHVHVDFSYYLQYMYL